MNRTRSQRRAWIAVGIFLLGLALAVVLIIALGIRLSAGSEGGFRRLAEDPAPLNVICIDTSESASKALKVFQAHALQWIQDLSPSEVMLFKFDSTAANIYEGASERSEEEWAGVIRSLDEVRRGGITGTNLLDLLGTVDVHTRERSAKMVIRVYTDAGIDGMPDEQLKQCREFLVRWRSEGRIESFTMLGVKPDWRRKLVMNLGDQVRFEDL